MGSLPKLRSCIVVARVALIFSALAVLTGTASAQEQKWGDFKGQIIVEGKLPEIEREKIDKDRSSCLTGKEPPLDDNLIVSKDGGFKDVFVMMLRSEDDPLPPIHPDYDRQLQQPVVLDNKNCRFEPHALFVRIGQPLRMKNSDDVGHNCHVKLFNNEINVNIPIGEHVDVKLEEFEKVPGNVVCDIHSWMDAVLLVRDEPYVAITDADGKFQIKNVPTGKWEFQFWHKRVGYMRKLQIPDYKVGRRGEIEIEIGDEMQLDLGKLKLDSSAIRKR